MTQAFNLAQLANAVDTSGRLNVGTNATGVLPLDNGGTGTTNTVNSVVAGSGISVSTSGTQVTITNTSSATGTVTSVATGNGLSGGTITTSGTLVVACPSAGSVGSYALLEQAPMSGDISFGGTKAGNLVTAYTVQSGAGSSSVSGTWRCMGVSYTQSYESAIRTVWCRVS